MTRKFGPSWKQSTGQTSTQSVYLHLMQFSVTTKVIFLQGKGQSFMISNLGCALSEFVTLPATIPAASDRVIEGAGSAVGNCSKLPAGRWRESFP
jgi:hypothetical protein